MGLESCPLQAAIKAVFEDMWLLVLQKNDVDSQTKKTVNI